MTGHDRVARAFIERELHDVAFWAFLTNKPDENYPTRIELLFELLAGKPPAGEPFHTFFYVKDQFEKAPRDEDPRKKVWEQIQDRHALLKEWYEDRDLYHKIGYLVVTSDDAANELSRLLSKSDRINKKPFHQQLDQLITELLYLGHDAIEDLAYDKSAWRCSRVLLLFNVPKDGPAH